MELEELEFFASCVGGLEQTLAQELKSFGIQRVRPLGGGAAFFCGPSEALRACLWSRTASRILLVVGRIDAGNADSLYDGAYRLEWEEILADDATIAVRAHGTNDQLRNTRFTALKVKDAIADRMREKRNERPVVDTASPRAVVDVRIRDGKATISLDFSGEALSHRPYLAPDDKDEAALSCSLAAGALILGGWPELASRGAVLVDPVCRDGIMLTEAVLIACDAAPSLGRSKWGFAGWKHYDESIWQALLQEAEQRFAAGRTRMGVPSDSDARTTPPAPSFESRPDPSSIRFLGTSTSSPSITRARNHIRHAGLRPLVSVELADAEGMAEAIGSHKALRRSRLAVVASNLDANSRLDASCALVADEMAFVAAAVSLPGGTRFIAAGSLDMPSRFGLEPSVRHRIGKGRIETTIDIFDSKPDNAATVEIADLEGGSPHRVQVLEESSGQFAARLRKMFKQRRKWAADQSIGCYRIYDSDLPDYAVAIDWYEGAGQARGNSYLHISEYAAPDSVDPEKARRRFIDVLAIAPVVCSVRCDHVFSKRRVREKGGGQYRTAQGRPYPTTVQEGGYLFEVDLAGRLDTGLFLDHRLTRQLVGESVGKLIGGFAERSTSNGERTEERAKGRTEGRAKGVRFLNLFAYTGTATVYAAGAKAAETTTVDLSQTYLEWARRNMQANGFSGANHTYIKADAMRWITETRRTSRRFDLIFVDPPTFSNSKAMGKKTWDVQRDHVELLIGVTHLLAEGGLAIFSCNLRSFKPYVDDLLKYGVEIQDISVGTIPEDFSRNPKIHRCYLVRKVGKNG